MMNDLAHRTLCVLGASAMLMGLAAVQTLQARPRTESLPAAAELPASVPAPAYLVREKEGLVAVFTGDGKQLLRLTDTGVAALPAADRACLSEGIPVSDDLSLAMLLEDYE